MPDVASVFGRHEFIIRRLHSLVGLVPVGAFLFVHFVTNVSILDGPATYQARVDQIHNLGATTLLVVEWCCIFLPILFHGVIGLIIIARGKRNVADYPYAENIRYTLQRWTGAIALVFIVWHVFHTRGWFLWTWWMTHVTRPLGGGTFDAAHAATTAAAGIQASTVILTLYAIGVLTCVYHLANGLWTMGITWGAWASPNAQRRANIPCIAVGLGLTTMGLAALVGLYVMKIP